MDRVVEDRADLYRYWLAEGQSVPLLVNLGEVEYSLSEELEIAEVGRGF